MSTAFAASFTSDGFTVLRPACFANSVACLAICRPTSSSTERISAWVKAHDEWSRRSYSAEDTVRLRKALVRYAAANRASDFVAAEQIVLGLDSLSYSLNDHDARRRVLDALFDTVKNATGFDPTRFASVAKTAAAEL